MLILPQFRRLTFLYLLFAATGFSLCILSPQARGRWQVLTEDRTWPRPLAMLATHFIDSKHGWAVTPFALLETRDGGGTWSEKFNGGDEDDFLSIAFIDGVRGLIVGGERKDASHAALFWNTTDGGTSWTRHTDNNMPPLSSISFCSATTGYASGSGIVISTSDGGRTWQPRFQKERDLHLMSVACFNSMQISAVGIDGAILHTDDGGKSWKREDVEMPVSLLRVRFFADTGWITGSGGLLLRTRDGGVTWERRTTGVNKSLTDIHLMGADGWITGSDGTLLRTRDGGESWREWGSPTRNDLASLFFIDAHHGWACGERLTMLGFAE